MLILSDKLSKLARLGKVELMLQYTREVSVSGGWREGGSATSRLEVFASSRLTLA